MFGEAHTVEDAAGAARLTVRGTETGVEPRAVVLEVLLTGSGNHLWLDALTPVEKRFQVLHGEVELDGARLAAGDRATVAAGIRARLRGTVGAQLVCDLKPAGEPAALAAALRRASDAERRSSWRAPAALALTAALLVGLTVTRDKPSAAPGQTGPAWSSQMHLGG
jgi:hypothetical protein